MYNPKQYDEAERIAEETGMGFLQALRHVQSRDELKNREYRMQRGIMLTRFNPDLITVSWR